MKMNNDDDDDNIITLFLSHLSKDTHLRPYVLFPTMCNCP